MKSLITAILLIQATIAFGEDGNASVNDFNVAGIKVGMTVGDFKKSFPGALPVKCEKPEGIEISAQKWVVLRAKHPKLKMLADSVEVDFIGGNAVGILAAYGPESFETIVPNTVETFGEKAATSVVKGNVTSITWTFEEPKRLVQMLVVKPENQVLLQVSDGSPYLTPTKSTKFVKPKF